MRGTAWLGAAGIVLTVWLASCAPLATTSPPPVPPSPVPGGPAEEIPVPRPTVPGEAAITIGLAWDLDSLTVDPVGAAGVTTRGGEQRLAADARLTVAATGEGWSAWSIGPNGRSRMGGAAGDTLWLRGVDGPEDGPARFIRWNGKSWRGTLKVFANPRGKVTLAVRLPLETYLLGVVPGEIGSLADDLLEAGRAQAIAARSYTLYYLGRRATEGFDLFGTVEDQVYGPVESEKPLATRCVTGTAGEVALADGRPIRANYCSTCGGITADVWEAWPTPPFSYLVGRRDRDGGTDHCAQSPHYRWREEWSTPEFLGNLARYGPSQGVRVPAGGLGQLVDVQVTRRSRSGRVWVLTVVTTRGTITIPAYSLRQVLRRPGNPSSILRSNLFKVDVRRDPGSRTAQAVVVSGAGSGHGVGLCQTGALAMAREGHRAEDILRHYYNGIEIRRTY